MMQVTATSWAGHLAFILTWGLGFQISTTFSRVSRLRPHMRASASDKNGMSQNDLTE
ncbi:hypothetical protein FKP32DRAFT_1598669 [Trametes sanguinea]|nr:hypothetical protein FKP32DRAFT_1598669 [Trametes sanguinea]